MSEGKKKALEQIMTRIEDLASKIKAARNDYYNGQSKVSDTVYDTWIDDLAELDPKNPEIIGIGADPVSEWPKYSHKVEMGSLNKKNTLDDLNSWRDKYGQGDLFLTLKLDGLSVSLVYEKGVLKVAASRGNGSIGENLLPNVAKMKGIPLRLKKKINATIRGEILLSKKDWKDHFADYSNPRNAASGISRRYDGDGSEHLTVLAHSLVLEEEKFDTQFEHFVHLRDLGFLVPDFWLLKTADEVWEKKKEFEDKLRDKYEFELDGLVVSQNDLEKQKEYGSHSGRPYWSMAVKFGAEFGRGKIKSIVSQVGGMGRITPVANFETPIRLSGADVERATLHNFGNVKELGIGVGAEVLVCRAGEVIPFVSEVIVPPAKVYEPPTSCPACDGELIENGEYVECVNQNCPKRLEGKIHNWINELNLLEWGDTLIERLVSSGKVSSVPDLYSLTQTDLESIERMGKKSAKKCLDILWGLTELPMEVMLGGLSIPLIGQSSIKVIMKAGIDTLEKIQAATIEDLEAVDGIGPGRAKSLVEGLKKNKEIIEKLLKAGIKVKEKKMTKKNCLVLEIGWFKDGSDETEKLSLDLLGFPPTDQGLSNFFDAVDIGSLEEEFETTIDTGGGEEQNGLWVANLDLVDLDSSTGAKKVAKKIVETITKELNLSAQSNSGKGKLTGKVFAITGTLSRDRKEIIADIEAAGGRVGNQVGPKTSHLVIADPTSTTKKAVNAREMGVKCISEAELLEMIG